MGPDAVEKSGRGQGGKAKPKPKPAALSNKIEDRKLTVNNATVAAASKPAPTTTDAEIARMAASSRQRMFGESRVPTLTNPTGGDGVTKRKTSAARYLGGEYNW